ncbi:MAG: seryl-tRNA synthetase [Candidatus Methanomethylophilaceae archaeon]|nr:seryl-tRNA synthetase [Candidatus Methanomethylophilaceae archaeon]MDI3541778.1 seryl-tRNA synthetase [Candidatus Methanomethylophilaceae archaeon]HIJ00729.1 serine--tRNA ligase [Candidatus Methanomethylophilaceae archaeon]
MLDANLIRKDPETIRKALIDRDYPTELLDEFLSIDAAWRDNLNQSNRLKSLRNDVSIEIARLEGKERETKIAEIKSISEKIKKLDAEIARLDALRVESLLLLPNIPHPSVPVGPDASGNIIIKTWMRERIFDFEPKEHFEIGEELDIIDFARGAKVAGSGFYVLKGDGARLERALINFMLDLHHSQGYREIFPPAVVNKESVIGTGQYPKMKDDMYFMERDELWLNPTAEVPVTNLHRDEIFDADELPVYYTAYLPSFRREAGRHSDTRGIARVHQFNKVEMVKFVHPEKSFEELESLLLDAEAVIQALELPYRVLLLCTGDMSFHASKCYDIELYAPGGSKWLEASSCSNFTDFQARRAHIKFRPEPHLKSEFVHTLNGSGVALPRTMVAILENYQNEDGSVTIPEVLRPYMSGQRRIG